MSKALFEIAQPKQNTNYYYYYYHYYYYYYVRIYGVNFKRMNNGLQGGIENFNYYCQRNSINNLKICVGDFLWPSITYLNVKKKKNC